MWGSWVNWMGSPVAILAQGDSHRVLVFSCYLTIHVDLSWFGYLLRVDLSRVFFCPCVSHRLFCSSFESIARVRNTKYKNFDVRWQSRLLCRSVEEALFVCSEVSSCARRDGRYRRVYDRFCVLERGSVIIPVFSGSLSRNISLQEKTGMSPLCVKVGLPPSSVID